MQAACTLLANSAGLIVKAWDEKHSVSSVCFDLKLCSVDINADPDLQPMPTYQLNLDLAPEQRWAQMCSMDKVKTHLQGLVALFKEILHPDAAKAFTELGDAAWALMPREYALEMQGCADAAGISTGMASVLNMAYELSDACTSIVAQGSDGQIYHARNLDFGFGMYFSLTLRQISAIVELTRNGQVVARETGFIGFMGMLSTQKPGQFSITVNTRYFQGGVAKSLFDMLTEFEFGIKNYPNAHFVAFLVRDVVMRAQNYSQAVDMLSHKELMADVYYTVSGIHAGEGIVITRNRTAPDNVWPLGSMASGPGSWFVLETNYDHWKPAPVFDDRRDAGYDNMAKMGQANLSLEGLMNVLSTRPTLNLLSTYSLLAVNSNSTYQSIRRSCSYPCVI